MIRVARSTDHDAIAQLWQRCGLTRSGIAAALMAAAEGRLRTLGAPKVNLQVRTSNLDVLAFYARLGYVDDEVVSLGKRLL